jgi:hypothetical protein
VLQVEPVAEPPGLRLVGEVDRDTHAVLIGALRLLDAQAGDVHLDVHGLTFIDVGGVRAIVRAAVALPPGRRMIVHGTTDCLRRTVEVFHDARVDEAVLLT